MTEPITRKEFDEMLADEELDLNPTARMVLYSFAMHMNYKDQIEYAYKTNVGIAAVAGVSEDTAKKYRDALVKCNFLLPTGDKARVGQYHLTPIYNLGRGNPTVKLIQRHRNGNSANLSKDDEQPSNSDRAGLATDESNSDRAGSANSSHSDRTGKPLRQNKVATPTEQVSHSDSLGAKNHKKNLHERTSYEEPPEPDGKDQDLSLSEEGETGVTAGGGEENSLEEKTSSILEEEGTDLIEEDEGTGSIALEGTSQATPTERGLLMDYELLARQNGVYSTYLNWMRISGVSKKEAFEGAMKQEGKA